MELLYCLLFTLLWKMTSSLRCHKCVPENTYEGIPLCEHFEATHKFAGDCEHSTMCFKRETTLDLGNGVTSLTVTRGCAAQTMSGNQQKINGKWRAVDTIYEVYEDDCKTDPGDPDRPTSTVNCYCRGDLCNRSMAVTASLALLIIPALLL